MFSTVAPPSYRKLQAVIGKRPTWRTKSALLLKAISLRFDQAVEAGRLIRNVDAERGQSGTGRNTRGNISPRHVGRNISFSLQVKAKRICPGDSERRRHFANEHLRTEI